MNVGLQCFLDKVPFVLLTEALNKRTGKRLKCNTNVTVTKMPKVSKCLPSWNVHVFQVSDSYFLCLCMYSSGILETIMCSYVSKFEIIIIVMNWFS